MKTGLKLKFVIYLIPLILLICAAFLFFHLSQVDYLAKSHLRDLGYELVRDLSYSSQPVIAGEDGFSFAPLIEGILEEREIALVAFYDSSGHVLFAEKRKVMEERMTEVMLDKISASEIPLCFEGSIDGGEKIYDCYASVRLEQEIIGYCRIVLTMESVYLARREAISQSILIAFLVLAMGFFASLALAEKMVKPIRFFIKGVKKIGAGNLNYRFRLKTRDEIAQLAEAFNRMTGQLQKSRKDLQEAKDVLEIRVKARTEELEEFARGLNEQVKERTKELSERLAELEKFHKLTVDREMKMIELKKEIKRLKDMIIAKKKK